MRHRNTKSATGRYKATNPAQPLWTWQSLPLFHPGVHPHCLMHRSTADVFIRHHHKKHVEAPPKPVTLILHFWGWAEAAVSGSGNELVGLDIPGGGKARIYAMRTLTRTLWALASSQTFSRTLQIAFRPPPRVLNHWPLFAAGRGAEGECVGWNLKPLGW